MLYNYWFGRRFLKAFTLFAMATRILHGTQLFEGIEKGLPNEHSCEIW